jgi:hypothetical protein
MLFLLSIIIPIILAFSQFSGQVNILFPKNDSICGEFLQLRVNIDVFDNENYVINQNFNNVSICVYKNDALFSCLLGYNPRTALVIGVDTGVLDLKVIASYQYIFNNSEYSAKSQDVVRVYRLPPHKTFDLSQDQLFQLINSLNSLYEPLYTSILFVSDSLNCFSSMYNMNVFENEVRMLLELSPERLILFDGISSCNTLDVGKLAVSRVQLNSFISSKLLAVPATVQLAIFKLLHCDANTTSVLHRYLINSEFYTRVLHRTSGHFVSYLYPIYLYPIYLYPIYCIPYICIPYIV